MKSKIAFIILSAAFLASVVCSAEPAGTRDRMDWFRDAKFGMFIHWGLYAVPAGEWDGKTNHGEWIQLQAKIPCEQYDKYAAQFNPVQFNAREWAQLAKDAGFKYLVITAKHHDGFCMYDTKFSDFSIVKSSPYGKDPIKELAQACRDVGIKFCIYYSIPDCLINDRLGTGSDYGTPEQYIPAGGQDRPFEVCMTMNGHWGYNKADQNWKSTDTLLFNLVDIVLAKDMVGKPLSIKIRSNGFDFEIFKKRPSEDKEWVPVTTGSYKKAKENEIQFRWGMYSGQKKGASVPNDAMHFVTGVTIR